MLLLGGGATGDSRTLVLVWDSSEYSGLGCVFVCRRVWVGGIGGDR